MITEALAALGISTKVAAAAAAGTLALAGGGAAVVASVPDKPETPVVVEAEAQDDEHRQDDGAGQDAEHRRDGGDNADSGVEAAEVETETGPPEDTHGATVSEAARNGTTGTDLADTASDGRSTARADNGAEARGDDGVEQQEAGQENQPEDTPAGPPAEPGSQADGTDADAERQDAEHRPETPAGPPAEDVDDE